MMNIEMNIEKLAIEHGSTCYTGQQYHFDKWQLEAFAKALKSSEPVACKYGNEPKSCTSSPMDCQCALDATLQSSEPFGYFKAEPFGWTDCAETDEGAIALYEHPPKQEGEPVWILSRDNKGRTTNIITGFPTKFDISKLPDGTVLYTLPPATVPLDKYNKLLDALREISNIELVTFEEWYKSHFDEDYDCEDSTSINIVERERIKDAWQASQAQQASVIAELVEAMLSASPIIDTITIDRTEYEAMKADAETIMQILTDPENQPSQYGTVPLSWYENLENKLERMRFEVSEVIDSLHGSYERHAIRKVLQKAIAELEAINRRQSMQIAHDGCTLESYESKFKALQATNKTLLDALRVLVSCSDHQNSEVFATALEQANEAIAEAEGK